MKFNRVEDRTGNVIIGFLIAFAVGLVFWMVFFAYFLRGA